MISTRNTHPDHSKISFTAKLVAHGRRDSDIPFAGEVADEVEAEKVVQDLIAETGVDPQELDILAPMVEARYKCINAAIQRSGITQILEFASGVTLRGLIMSQDPAIRYVETDLPGITAEKLRLVAKVKAKHQLPDYGNLFYHAVNVLSWPDIEMALSHFSTDKPVAVIHEGLFQYLSIPEKTIAARHIHHILSRFGGIWMTPDLNTKEEAKKSLLRQGAMGQIVKKISGATQRDFEEAAFANEEEVRAFLSRLGFAMCVVPQIDGSFNLSTTEKLALAPASVAAMAEGLKLWEMTVAEADVETRLS